MFFVFVFLEIKGAYGKVYRGKFRGRTVAIKTIEVNI